MTEIIPQRRSRTVYLLKKPLECLRRIPGIRSLRLAQHWAIQVGEDGDIWALERLSKQEIRLKKSERTEWEDAAKRWPKETIGTTDTNDTEIESVVLATFERMKGARPQNSLHDWEYAAASNLFHKVFHLGDYSIGRNNCQDLVATVAKVLTGKNIDLGTILKPKSARMFSRQQVQQSKNAGLQHHRNVALAHNNFGTIRHHHRHVHRSHH